MLPFKQALSTSFYFKTGGFFVFPTVLQRFPLVFFIAVCQYIDMVCPYCFHKKTSVANSRGSSKSATVWRRRHCLNCLTTFSTYETVEPDIIVTKYKSKDKFSIGKLHLSIAACFTHDNAHIGTDSYELAKTIQTVLLSKGGTISSRQLALIVHARLKNFDSLAAMQYGIKHQLVTSLKRKPGRPSAKFDVI